MKMVKQSKTPRFGGPTGGAASAGVRQHKQMAMGKQGQVSVTVKPGSRGSRKPGMKVS